MRARNIKPGFFKNEDLVECSFPARLLFSGLWCMADRKGRLGDRPKKIKMELFPADNLDCDELLDELASCGLIVRYAAEGGKYIWIPKFLAHQNPHKRESASQIPPAPGDPEAENEGQGAIEDVPREEPKPDQGQDKARPRPDQGPTKAQSSPADSLIPDSLIPEFKTEDQEQQGAGAKSDVPARPRGYIRTGGSIALFVQAFRRQPNGFEQPILADLELTYPEEALIYAFRETGERGATNLKYLQKVLEDCHDEKPARGKRKTAGKAQRPPQGTGGNASKTGAKRDWAGDMPAVGVG